MPWLGSGGGKPPLKSTAFPHNPTRTTWTRSGRVQNQSTVCPYQYLITTVETSSAAHLHVQLLSRLVLMTASTTMPLKQCGIVAAQDGRFPRMPGFREWRAVGRTKDQGSEQIGAAAHNGSDRRCSDSLLGPTSSQ